MQEFPQPEVTETNRPFWDGLKQGRLLFQTCPNNHRWLPARDFCPHCLSEKVSFVESSGRAKVISWVVYRTAFHDAFKDRIPYNVSLVQLEEGPRMMTNVLCDSNALEADMPLQLEIQSEGELAIARFRPVEEPKHITKVTT
jgi:uncharacterized OB-fold protein